MGLHSCRERAVLQLGWSSYCKYSLHVLDQLPRASFFLQLFEDCCAASSAYGQWRHAAFATALQSDAGQHPDLTALLIAARIAPQTQVQLVSTTATSYRTAPISQAAAAALDPNTAAAKEAGACTALEALRDSMRQLWLAAASQADAWGEGPLPGTQAAAAPARGQQPSHCAAPGAQVAAAPTAAAPGSAAAAANMVQLRVQLVQCALSACRALQDWTAARRLLLQADNELLFPWLPTLFPTPPASATALKKLLAEGPVALRETASVARWCVRHQSNAAGAARFKVR